MHDLSSMRYAKPKSKDIYLEYFTLTNFIDNILNIYICVAFMQKTCDCI